VASDVVPFVFLDIAIVIAVARLMGRLFVRLRQPAVIGEILGGIMLGPSVLGLLPGNLPQVLFPADVRPHLTVIAQLGLVLFMFIVGLEVDLRLIQSRRRVATAVSLSSIALPFGLGVALALAIYPAHAGPDDGRVSPVAFALFLGAAMSITAFPVLARILTERRMHRTPVGVLALACAAIDDVVAWSLLAVVVAVAVGGTLAGFGTILLLTAVYALVMIVAVRPLLARLTIRYRAAGRLTPDVLAGVLAGLLLSACATEWIGIHAIFGAFLFGAIMPRSEPALTRAVLQRLEQVSTLLLLPVFFVIAGLQVDVRGVGSAGVVELLMILVAAIGGKFLGALAAARLSRVPHRQAVALGVLMNTRGLTEIVILQVGAQLGVLDTRLFTLMVLMALITTIMTEPLLRRVYPDRIVARDIAEAERAELGDADSFGVLVSLSEGTADGRRLVALASALVGRERPARIVLARLLATPRVPLELASGLGSDLLAVTNAGDELRRLAPAATPDGVRSQVVARFSASPLGDVAALAGDVGADVVVVPEPPEGADPAADLPDVGEAALAVVRPAEGAHASSAVHVLLDGSGAGRAAVRLAGRIALHLDAPISVGGTGDPDRRSARRATAAVEALRRLGLDAAELSERPDAGAPAVLVVPEQGGAQPTAQPIAPPIAPSTTVIRVRPAASDEDEDLQQALARIPAMR
jgi:Kef-type K+ transport system membrane component KefB